MESAKQYILSIPFGYCGMAMKAITLTKPYVECVATCYSCDDIHCIYSLVIRERVKREILAMPRFTCVSCYRPVAGNVTVDDWSEGIVMCVECLISHGFLSAEYA